MIITTKFLLCKSSVTQSCPTLCDPMDCSTPGFPVHHVRQTTATPRAGRPSAGPASLRVGCVGGGVAPWGPQPGPSAECLGPRPLLAKPGHRFAFRRSGLIPGTQRALYLERLESPLKGSFPAVQAEAPFPSSRWKDLHPCRICCFPPGTGTVRVWFCAPPGYKHTWLGVL